MVDGQHAAAERVQVYDSVGKGHGHERTESHIDGLRRNDRREVERRGNGQDNRPADEAGAIP